MHSTAPAFALLIVASIASSSVRAGAPQVATYAAGAFIAAESQGDFEASLNGCMRRTSTDILRLAQDVQLPSGAVIEALRLFFVEGSSGQPGIELTLNHNPFDGDVTALGVALADTSGVQVIEVPIAHTVDPAAGALVLRAELSGTGYFCAAQLDYTPPPSADTSRSLTLDASSFQPNRDFTSWTDMGNGCIRFGGTVPPIAAYDLQLPQGALIEGVDIFYFDQNSSPLGELLVRLARRDRDQLMPETLATLSSNTNDGFGMASVAVNHVVDNARDGLYLEWLQAVSSSTLGLCGVRVRYVSSAPLAPAYGTLNVAGASFAPRDSQTRHGPNNGCLDQLSAGRVVYSPFAVDVQLPQGAPIIGIGISFIDNDMNEDVSVTLLGFDTDYTLFGADGPAEVSSSGASPELRMATAQATYSYAVDNPDNSLVLVARLEQAGTSANLLLCNVFVDFGEVPDEVFADGFEGQDP